MEEYRLNDKLTTIIKQYKNKKTVSVDGGLGACCESGNINEGIDDQKQQGLLSQIKLSAYFEKNKW